MADRAISLVPVGFTVRHHRTINEGVIRQFADESGDFSPLHLDEEYAKRTVFGHRIAHGILALGLVSAALSKLPGVVIYVSQTVRFTRPVKIGDVIEAVVEVVEKSEDRNEATLRTYVENQEGERVLDGEAKVRLFDLSQQPVYTDPGRCRERRLYERGLIRYLAASSAAVNTAPSSRPAELWGVSRPFLRRGWPRTTIS